MSTRSNIIVRAFGSKEEIQLYRHCDGYPTSVLPSLETAYRLSGGDWQAGRVGKAAAFICTAGYKEMEGIDDAVKPYTAYEVDPEIGLHGGVEWVYVITLLNNPKYKGKNDKEILWKVEVFVPAEGFWDDPTFDRLRLIDGGMLGDVTARADNLELRKWNNESK